MTSDQFASLATGLAGVQARPVLETVVYAVGERAFATLGWPGEGWAVVKLAPCDQARLVAAHRAVRPEPERGRLGVTLVRLSGLDEAAGAEVLAAAWALAHGATRRAGPVARTGAAAAARPAARVG